MLEMSLIVFDSVRSWSWKNTICTIHDLRIRHWFSIFFSNRINNGTFEGPRRLNCCWRWIHVLPRSFALASGWWRKLPKCSCHFGSSRMHGWSQFDFFWNVFRSILWCALASQLTGFALMQTTSTMLRKTSPKILERVPSTRPCSFVKEYFWCWIRRQRHFVASGVVLRRALQCGAQCWEMV